MTPLRWENKLKKQQEFVLHKLKAKERVTSLTMFAFGITRLSNVILKLRNKGHEIATEAYVSGDGVTFASYVLLSEKAVA